MASEDARGAAEPDFKDMEATKTLLKEKFEALDASAVKVLTPVFRAFFARPEIQAVCKSPKFSVEGSASAGPNKEAPEDKSFYRFCLRVRTINSSIPDCEAIRKFDMDGVNREAQTALMPILNAFCEENRGLFPYGKVDVKTLVVLGKNREAPSDASFFRYYLRLTTDRPQRSHD